MREIIKFCERAGILDKKLNSAAVQTYFKASNFEEVEQENNDDNALCRFEFMEILVRCAKGKYLDNSKDKSLYNAVKRLIEDKILDTTNTMVPWHRFRLEQLWTNEVNDLLEVNLGALRILFETIAKTKKFKVRCNRTEVFVT